MGRTFHQDSENRRILITDHPSIKRLWLTKGYGIIPGRSARHLTYKEGYTYQLVNGNWK